MLKTKKKRFTAPRTGKRSPDWKAPRTSEGERGQEDAKYAKGRKNNNVG
jgi:hypothetical protein